MLSFEVRNDLMSVYVHDFIFKFMWYMYVSLPGTRSLLNELALFEKHVNNLCSENLQTVDLTAIVDREFYIHVTVTAMLGTYYTSE